MKALSISRMGMPYDGKLREGAIYRVRGTPPKPVNYPFLVVSHNPSEPLDILMINEFNTFKRQAKKNFQKGIGIELTINPVRKMDSGSIAKWFANLSELYRFCISSGCQFIISSGATSKYELISGPCFNAILKIIGVQPQNHWMSMSKWLDEKLGENRAYAE